MNPITKYLKESTTRALTIDTDPVNHLKYVVVIPCYDEEDILHTLNSIYMAHPPEGGIEVIIVVNSSESDTLDVVSRNQTSFRQIKKWNDTLNSPHIQFHPIYLDNLADKEAGPGIARKTGMDTALLRIKQSGCEDGHIISLDADCEIKPNYFTTIEQTLKEQKKVNAGIIYFEHPLEGNKCSSANYQAAANYELFLRYYNRGLAFAGFPYPFHTIGSAFFVRAEAYAKQGGMNKRKAGEDFYFLNKIFQLGHIHEVNKTCVIPSPRPSERVLFGTGPEIKKMSANHKMEYKVYDPNYFKILQSFFNTTLSEFYKRSIDKIDDILKDQSLELMNFLGKNNFKKEIKRLKDNCASEQTFRKQFFHWFNGLRVIQFMHSVHEDENKKVPVFEASRYLLKQMGVNDDSKNVYELLKTYRKIERENSYKIS